MGILIWLTLVFLQITHTAVGIHSVIYTLLKLLVDGYNNSILYNISTSNGT